MNRGFSHCSADFYHCGTKFTEPENGRFRTFPDRSAMSKSCMPVLDNHRDGYSYHVHGIGIPIFGIFNIEEFPKQSLDPAICFYMPRRSNDYFLNGLSGKTIVLVWGVIIKNSKRNYFFMP